MTPDPQRRIVVTRGHPTDTELAAVTTALLRHGRRPAAAASPAPSRWAVAARLEGRGHPSIDSPAELTR